MALATSTIFEWKLNFIEFLIYLQYSYTSIKNFVLVSLKISVIQTKVLEYFFLIS